MKITMLSREFHFTGRGLLLYVLAMALLCSLGFWQLGRAEQKRQFLQQQQAAGEAAVLDLNREANIDGSELRYQKVTVKGHYDVEHQFLLDNQIQNGKPGYFVLTPFLIDGDERAVLVNRGWLALGKDRSTLPELAIEGKVDRVEGRINHFPSVGIRLQGAEIPGEGWPSLLQLADSRRLAEKLAYDVYDFQIELNPEAAEGYQRQWQTVTIIPPEKHLAYAVQWFGLALALTGWFIWISIRKTQ